MRILTAMVTPTLALGLALGLAGCAAQTSIDEGETGQTVSASAETTALTGIIGWEVVKTDARYAVIGRDAKGLTVTRIATHVDGGACQNGATVVTLEVTEPTPGTKVIGCDGQTTRDDLTDASRLALQRLDADLDAKNAGKTPPPPVSAAPLSPKLITNDPWSGGGGGGGPGWTCAPEICGCEIKTDTKCFGVVEVCNDHRRDCTTSGWHPCGVCIGFPW
ncbi:MAG: hypothetical protein HOO96_34355 [Polyangiaceae bacterium]|nr:hypothetical protein [Polyangiaceae bacterium]